MPKSEHALKVLFNDARTCCLTCHSSFMPLVQKYRETNPEFPCRCCQYQVICADCAEICTLYCDGSTAVMSASSFLYLTEIDYLKAALLHRTYKAVLTSINKCKELH